MSVNLLKSLKLEPEEYARMVEWHSQAVVNLVSKKDEVGIYLDLLKEVYGKAYFLEVITYLVNKHPEIRWTRRKEGK